MRSNQIRITLHNEKQAKVSLVNGINQTKTPPAHKHTNMLDSTSLFIFISLHLHLCLFSSLSLFRLVLSSPLPSCHVFSSSVLSCLLLFRVVLSSPSLSCLVSLSLSVSPSAVSLFLSPCCVVVVLLLCCGVHAENPRVYVQNATVCTGTTRTC